MATDDDAVEFSAKFERFSVEGDKVKVALSARRRPGILDRLADLHESESVWIRIEDSQQHLRLFDGADGHKYPMADPAGRPLGAAPAPQAPAAPKPPADGTSEQLRLGDPEPDPAGDGQVHLQGPDGEELGAAMVRDDTGNPVEGTARVAADGSVEQTGHGPAWVPNRPPKPAERVTIGGVSRLLTGWARAVGAPLGQTEPLVRWLAAFHAAFTCEIDPQAAVERLQRDGSAEIEVTLADTLRLLGMCAVTWLDAPPSGDSKKPNAAEEWLRNRFPEGASAAEIAQGLNIAPEIARRQLEPGREAGRLFAFAGRYIPADRVVEIGVAGLSELLGELERWESIQHGQGLTIQQVAERIHVPRKVATDRLHAAMKAGLVRYDAGIYTLARADEEAAV